MNSQYGRAGDVRKVFENFLFFITQACFQIVGVSVIKGPSSSTIDPKDVMSPVRGSASAAALKWVSK